jgi:hypothetical protein
MDARAKRITKLELGTGTFSNVLALWLLHFHTRDVDTVYRILHIYITRATRGLPRPTA